MGEGWDGGEVANASTVVVSTYPSHPSMEEEPAPARERHPCGGRGRVRACSEPVEGHAGKLA